jgi:ferredoxin-NADP reductase
MAVEYTGRVERLLDHGPATRSLLLRPEAPLHFPPGQFLSCLLPVESAVLTRPYSIASDPESPDLLELVVDLVPGGPGSHHLFSLRPGDTVRYTGPWGTFTLEEAPPVETVFVALDTGIAPIRPMLRRALATAVRPVTLVYGRSAGAPMLFATELTAARPEFTLLAPAAADLLPSVERRYAGGDAGRQRHFFVCGVGEVVHRIRDVLRGAGYERRAVRYEKW